MSISRLCSDNVLAYCAQLKSLGEGDSAALDEQSAVIIHGVENPRSEKDLKKAAKKLVRMFIDVYFNLPTDEAKLCVKDEREALRKLKRFYKYTIPSVKNKLRTGREKLGKLNLCTKRTWDPAVVPLFQKGAERGFPKAQFNLGIIYYKGYGVEKDEEKAIGIFKSAAEQGFTRAFSLLEEVCQGKAEVEKTALLLSCLLKAADAGSADAQIKLAFKYKLGIDVAQDDKRAFELFQLAAEQKAKHAQYMLADYYLQGTLVEKDEEKALTLLTASAEQGDPGAQFTLAMCLRKQNNPEENPKIVNLLQSAAVKITRRHCFF